MSAPAGFRFVGRKRRVREDRRFVVGEGRYVADVVLPGMLHLAPLASEHACADILDIDLAAALAAPGVRAAITGADLVGNIEPLPNGLDTPNIRRFPLAVGRTRYAGEWIAAIVADTRAQAEDARERVRVRMQRQPFVLDAEEAYQPGSSPVHPEHGGNVVLDRQFSWGAVDKAFADAPHQLSYRVAWGRSSTVPIETFGVVARWNAWANELDIWASIQMPKYSEAIARTLRLPGNCIRVHNDVDVGGSYGVKRGIKQTILAAFLSRRLDRPVRLIEDRLENMSGGDAHGPERTFDVELAFEQDGAIRAMRMRAIDNVGAYPGRSPFQLGKPVGAIVGPYQIGAVAYRAIAVTTNKAPQDAVRGFGQAPTNYAIETGLDHVANFLGLDRLAVRRRNFIRAEQFPYEIPSGATYDSGDYHAVIDKVAAAAAYEELVVERDRLRADGMLAGVGVAACLEPSGGNSSFEALLNPKTSTSTFMESCRVNIDGAGAVTATLHTSSSGQGHETLVAVAAGEALEIEPETIRVIRPDSLASLPTHSPIGSRMAIMLGGAAFNAANKLKRTLIEIGAYALGVDEKAVTYTQGDVIGPSGRQVKWSELVQIAHREFHRLKPGLEPGLSASHTLQVPGGGELPNEKRAPMAPCFSFECHLLLLTIDPELGKPEIRRYVLGHDCGTVINPDIVRGMALGGVAHGVGAALLEEFVYDNTGQLASASLMDYVLPSAHEMPKVELVHHCTPSPLTTFGQKGAGESGYLGAPAAIASAVNDALSPLGARLDRLPMRVATLGDLIAAALENRTKAR